MYILDSSKYFSKQNCVEITGMPASGKTTFVRQLMDENSNTINVNGILPKNNLWRQFKKIMYAFLLFLRFPSLFLKDTKIIISSKQNSYKNLYSVLTNWYLIIYQYKKYSSGKAIYLWDQGLFQGIWSIYYSSSSNFNYKYLLEDKTLPQTVYLTDADDLELIFRSNKRKDNIRLDYNNKEEIINGREAMEKTINVMQQIGYQKTTDRSFKEV